MPICEFCGSEYEEDPFEENLGYCLCDSCRSPEYPECNNCGKADWSVEYQAESDEYLCSDCRGRKSTGSPDGRMEKS